MRQRPTSSPAQILRGPPLPNTLWLLNTQLSHKQFLQQCHLQFHIRLQDFPFVTIELVGTRPRIRSFEEGHIVVVLGDRELNDFAAKLREDEEEVVHDEPVGREEGGEDFGDWTEGEVEAVAGDEALGGGGEGVPGCHVGLGLGGEEDEVGSRLG